MHGVVVVAIGDWDSELFNPAVGFSDNLCMKAVAVLRVLALVCRSSGAC